ncbi:hypothetical protein BPY_22850 [Bifidobacterium psychraerophilum]|uniref:hypothetical protein n=1 Tax=Bifidobacterium psychraerophilum TaxID=218140 RepID=UPI003116E87C
MSWTVKTPVKGFTGQVAGVVFKDGVGICEGDPAYFHRHGYEVAETQPQPAQEEQASEPVADEQSQPEPEAEKAAGKAKK